jgi:GNAT superfamily N-acetyltransferase
MSAQTIEVRYARETEAELVSSVLIEAATWIAECGEPLWSIDELGVEAIQAGVSAGRFILASVDTEMVGTARLTRDDPECWPDAASGTAVYVHRLAIRRSWAGRGIPGMILAWCARRAEILGCSFLRLDCDAKRWKLCRLYEGLGFRIHSEQRVGPHTVVRYERALHSEE